MDRDGEGVAAAVAIVPLLYIAWLFTWFGTFAGTCTGSDPKSLSAGMFYSFLFYAVGIFCLQRSDLGTAGFIFALPLVGLLLRQATWGAELFVVVYVNGKSACSLLTGEEFGVTHGGVEYIHPVYYLAVSIASIVAIVLSHLRNRRGRKQTQSFDTCD